MNLGPARCFFLWDRPFPAGIVIILFLLVSPLHGGGEAEGSLDRVDALIEGECFDEALEALARYSRENPWNSGYTDRRLRRLAEVQGRYNGLVNQLLDAVAEDPADGEKILALSGELEALAPPRHLRTGEFLGRVRELVKSTLRRQRLEEIFARGREKSGAGDYSGALGLYLGGLEFYRGEFFGGQEDPGNPVRDPLLRLSVLGGELESSLAVLNGAAEDLDRAPPEAQEDVFRRIRQELDKLERMGREIGEAGVLLDGLLLREEDPARGDTFPFFASLLIHGREGEDGMIRLLEDYRTEQGRALEFAGSRRGWAALNRELAARLERREAELALADRLMGGEGKEAAEALREAQGSADFPESPEGGYSREALGIFQNLKAAVEEDLAYAGESFVWSGEGEGPAPPGLEALRAETAKMTADLEALRDRSTEGAARAEERLLRAEDLRAQGDRLYQAARDAAARGDFAGARLSIQQASERYSQALALQEFPSLREEWDTRMLSLGEEIGRRENESIVQDTREALNQVRSEYLAGNFQHAENLLVRGQNRWMETNADENPEISYWLSMVRNTISLRSGREIPATAPLFAEMGQFLNEARGHYGEGVALIRAGRRDEGLARFNEARRSIREVKYIFPGNLEAGLLELRMDQMADPEVFNASFQRRLDEALAGIRARSTEAFGDLQNLAEINPSYPGIAGALKQAEIDMGYRPAPPDPRKLQRSAGLTAAARDIVEANDREHFGAALRQLNEALVLDPDNTQAMILKDLVQTRMGAGNAVLSSADEGEYQRAVRELQQGNTLVSLSIVERLLQNPRNRNSTRILELRRRVQSFL